MTTGPENALPARRAALRFVIDGRRVALARLAGTAFLGGLIEAAFLIVVTRAAFAITDGNDEVGLLADRYLPLNTTLLVAAAALFVRVALAALASWQAANLSSSVVADVRTRLSSAFIDASWEVQQSERSGSLQELLTTYSGYTSALMGGVAQGVLSAANLVALLGLAIAVDPVGAVVLVVFVGILGLLLRPLRQVIRERTRESAMAGMEFATGLSELSQLGLELHVFQVQDQARFRVDQLIRDARTKAARLSFVAGFASPVYSGLAYLALLGGLALTALSSATNLTSIGAVMLVMLRSLSYGQALQNAYTTSSASIPPIEELRHRLEHLSAAQRRDGGQPVTRIGDVRVEGLSFSVSQRAPGAPRSRLRPPAETDRRHRRTIWWWQVHARPAPARAPRPRGRSGHRRWS